MSLPKELLDAKGLSEGASLGPHISAIRASYRCSSLNLDDYVGDYRPIPIWGCLRTYKISSSGDPTIKLDRYFEEFEGSFETPISEKPGDLENFAVVSVRVSPREIRQDIESKKGPGCKIGMKEVINLLKIPSRPTLDEHSAVETLLSKLANEAPFTYDKTIQAAISAIQRLYHHALFQDDEIEVLEERVGSVNYWKGRRLDATWQPSIIMRFKKIMKWELITPSIQFLRLLFLKPSL